MHLGHPEIPSCADCRRWLYDADWTRAERPKGTPTPRPAHCPSPCWKCPKSRDGRPNPGADMRGRVWQTYTLWLAVRAGMPMPDDLLTVRNCALIQLAVDRIDRRRSDVTLLLRALSR